MGVTQNALTVNFPHMLDEQSRHIAELVRHAGERQAQVMEPTAGITRAATSANEGELTEVTGPELVWMGADCALDLRIIPRSELRTTPKATEAMMIARVDKKRLVDGLM